MPVGVAHVTEEVIDPGSEVPPYRELAEILKRRIRSGVYPLGSRLPSIIGLSSEFHLWPGPRATGP
jgi:DNA-binding GntR family transcriptional regulator